MPTSFVSLRALRMHLRPAEQLAHLVGVDLAVVDHSGVAGRDAARDLARDRADLALELTHAALARVVATRRDITASSVKLTFLSPSPDSSSWRGIRYFFAISAFSRSV